MRESREEQAGSPDLLARGLMTLFRGENTPEAHASASIVAEYVIRSIGKLKQKEQ